MTTRSALSIALFLLRLSAAVFVVFLTTSTGYAQVSDIMQRRDALILRAPGSRIGVSTRDRTPAEARQTHDKAAFWTGWVFAPNGVIIEEVRADSPASRAGLMQEDAVTVFDGQRVLNANQFSRLVEETPPGWTVKMTIVRGGKVRELSITPTL
jgi:S1-C subfamily serine protease